MKFTRRQAATLLATPAVFYATGSLTPTKIAAANKINPEFREAVQAAMLDYIDSTAINGKHLIFDPIVGDYVQASFYMCILNWKSAKTFLIICQIKSSIPFSNWQRGSHKCFLIFSISPIRFTGWLVLSI